MLSSLKLVFPLVMAGAASQAQEAPPPNRAMLQAVCVDEKLVAMFTGCANVPSFGITVYAPGQAPSRMVYTSQQCFTVGVLDPDYLPVVVQRFQFMGIPDMERLERAAEASFADEQALCGQPTPSS